jgi:hypothetical protein
VIKSRRIRWAGHVASMGAMKNVYKLLVEKSEGKRQLGRSWSRWEDNIKMELWKIEWEVVVCIHEAWDGD